MDDSFLEGGGLVSGSPSADDLLQGGSGRNDGDQDWNYDPSEPRYCVCNQVSYGDMVACDNEDVSIQKYGSVRSHVPLCRRQRDCLLPQSCNISRPEGKLTLNPGDKVIKFCIKGV